jgi:hypothetical protein
MHAFGIWLAMAGQLVAGNAKMEFMDFLLCGVVWDACLGLGGVVFCRRA